MSRKINKNAEETVFKAGDRVGWDSQAAGSWKRKIGTVIQVEEDRGQLIVEVDRIASLYPDGHIGDWKILKTPKLYNPYKSLCVKVHSR